MFYVLVDLVELPVIPLDVPGPGFDFSPAARVPDRGKVLGSPLPFGVGVDEVLFRFAKCLLHCILH